jgi:hypothetical protein
MAVLLLVILACVPAGLLLPATLARLRRQVAGAVPMGSAALPPEVIRRTAGWRWAGIAVGLLAGTLAADSGALGRGLLLAAPVFGLCVVAGVVVGETSVRRPGGRARTASVEVRRVRDYVPRGLATAVFAEATLLVGLLSVTTATGAADDLGRGGRILVLQCSQALQTGAGPWPGSYYSVPLAAVVVAGLTAAGFALKAVVRRPRAGADPAMVAADDALRWRAAQAIASACGILLGLPLAGVSLIASTALLRLSCAPVWLTVAAWVILALVPAAVVVIGWCAALLLTPARGSSRLLPGP